MARIADKAVRNPALLYGHAINLNSVNLAHSLRPSYLARNSRFSPFVLGIRYKKSYLGETIQHCTQESEENESVVGHHAGHGSQAHESTAVNAGS